LDKAMVEENLKASSGLSSERRENGSGFQAASIIKGQKTWLGIQMLEVGERIGWAGCMKA